MMPVTRVAAEITSAAMGEISGGASDREVELRTRRCEIVAVGSVVARHVIEVRNLHGMRGGLDAGKAGIADRTRRQSGEATCVVRRVELQIACREVGLPIPEG